MEELKGNLHVELEVPVIVGTSAMLPSRLFWNQAKPKCGYRIHELLRSLSFLQLSTGTF